MLSAVNTVNTLPYVVEYSDQVCVGDMWFAHGCIIPARGRYTKRMSKLPTLDEARKGMVAKAEWAVAHHDRFHYDEERPFPLPHDLPGPGEHIWIDCSGFATLLSFWGGGGDPNGYHWNGLGNGESMAQHLKWIPQYDTLPGDFVCYAPYHVTIIMEPGTRTNLYTQKVVSMGHEGDPNFYENGEFLREFPGAESIYMRLKARE